MKWLGLAFMLAAAVLFASCQVAYAQNSVPVITSLEVDLHAQAGIAGAYHIYADDPEGEQVWFKIEWGDGEASEGDGNSFTHAYSQQGSYEITASATDPQGASSQVTAEANVDPAPAPICPGYPSLRVGENMVVGSYAIAFDGTSVATTDNDHPGLFRLYHGPNLIKSGLKLGRDTVVRITAANGDKLEIDHCLSYGGFTLESNIARVKLIVNENTAGNNQPPVITGIGGPSELVDEENGIWTVIAHDPDGTYLIYSVIWGDEGDSAKHAAPVSTATFQHAYSQPGNYTLTFSVKDGKGAITQASISVEVQNAIISDEMPPEPPALEQPSQSVQPGGAAELPQPNASLPQIVPHEPIHASASSAMPVSVEPRQPPLGQPSQLDRIIALLEEIKQLLLKFLGKE
jgi:plastocyanin